MFADAAATATQENQSAQEASSTWVKKGLLSVIKSLLMSRPAEAPGSEERR
jgi:hypothetical protein